MDNFKNWPPTLAKHEIEQLLHYAVSWGLSHGFVMRPSGAQVEIVSVKDNNTQEITEGQMNASIAMHAPFALFPSPFPKLAYTKALQLQPHFNQLVHAVSEDHAFLDQLFSQLLHLDLLSYNVTLDYHMWMNLLENYIRYGKMLKTFPDKV